MLPICCYALLVGLIVCTPFGFSFGFGYLLFHYTKQYKLTQKHEAKIILLSSADLSFNGANAIICNKLSLRAS
jgi:hypothetical protein